MDPSRDPGLPKAAVTAEPAPIIASEDSLLDPLARRQARIRRIVRDILIVIALVLASTPAIAYIIAMQPVAGSKVQATPPVAIATPKPLNLKMLARPVTGAKLYRVTNSQESPVIVTAPFSQTIAITADVDATWYMATYGGQSGYVQKSDVAADNAALTADWVTYQDGLDGLSFRYPKEWKYQHEYATKDFFGRPTDGVIIEAPDGLQLRFHTGVPQVAPKDCPGCAVVGAVASNVASWQLAEVNTTATGIGQINRLTMLSPAVSPGVHSDLQSLILPGSPKTAGYRVTLDAGFPLSGGLTDERYSPIDAPDFRSVPSVTVARFILMSVVKS